MDFRDRQRMKQPDCWGNDWTTELAQVHGEIASVTDIIPEKEVYLNGMDFHIISRYTDYDPLSGQREQNDEMAR